MSEGASSSYLGTRIAYRSWKVVMSEKDDPSNPGRKKSYLALSAIVHNSIWKPYEKMGPNCSHSRLYEVGCSCGIYAYKSMRGLPDYVKSISRNQISLGSEYEIGVVLGEVEIWGRCLEHSKGWRAEFAYPKSFYCPEEASIDYEGLVHRVAANYGIEVKMTTVRELKAMVFGSED